jgi:hypothetical protein
VAMHMRTAHRIRLSLSLQAPFSLYTSSTLCDFLLALGGHHPRSGRGHTQGPVETHGRPAGWDAWWPGAALAVELRLPTGVERRGFENRVDVGFTGLLKKDVGRHSFHLNVDFERIGDTSAEESLRTYVWDVVVGHDMSLTPPGSSCSKTSSGGKRTCGGPRMSKSLHTRFIHSMLQTHGYYTPTCAVSVRMLCGSI